MSKDPSNVNDFADIEARMEASDTNGMELPENSHLAVDSEALVNAKAKEKAHVNTNESQLYGFDDADTASNTHEAIHNVLRLMKNI